eukprot:2233252-Pleurochrysis_carterae.AAC.1
MACVVDSLTSLRRMVSGASIVGGACERKDERGRSEEDAKEENVRWRGGKSGESRGQNDQLGEVRAQGAELRLPATGGLRVEVTLR